MGRRGPKPNTTGYHARDRELFPQISRMLKKGEARSSNGAACELAKAKKIAGKGNLD